jgi:TonB-dependent receptor
LKLGHVSDLKTSRNRHCCNATRGIDPVGGNAMRVVRSSLLTQSAILSLSAMFVAALPITAVHAQDAVPEASDGNSEIVVTGTRLSLRAATAEKRNADNFVEALQANDVGKLPDQNVAEAVKRLPGLSVANDQGEGRYVIIRGIDPSLINVALNGQTLPAPEPGARQVKLDDLPSAMIQSITITKSLLPSQDANAIGGEVNIRTKSAFDSSARFFFDARGAIGWYALNKKSPYEADGTVGGRFGPDDQFGAVLSVNYSRRPIESENFQGGGTFTAITGGALPDQGGLRDYNLIRTRLGVVGNLDWKPNDMARVYLRASYSRFTDDEIRDQNRLDALSTLTTSPTTPCAGAPPLSTLTGNFCGRGSVLVRARKEHDNTKSVTIGSEFETSNSGTFEMSAGWTKAVKLDPLRSEFRFRTGNNAVAGTYDAGTDPFIFKPFIGADLTKYIFNSLNIETRQAAEQIWQTRFDYTLPIGMEGSSLKIGFKFLDRRKTNNQDRTNYGTVSGPSGSASFQLPSVTYMADTGFYDGRYPFGPRIDYWAARAYVDSHPGVVALTPGSTLSDSLANDSDAREDIYSVYAMFTVKTGNWTVIPGVRLEYTQDKFFAKVVNSQSKLTDGFNSQGGNGYTHIFPGLNVKYEAMRNLLVRAAATTSIGRPNYSSLVPFVVVDSTATPPAILLGNPELQPYRSINLDGSIEYYPNRDSLFSVGVFQKFIKDPIYSTTATLTNVTYAGITYPSASVTKPINVNEETVTGVEFNAQTQFTFLPGFLGGFGVSANYSHVWGHATATNIPGFTRTGDIPLGFQSSDIGNVQLFYEKYGFAARVAVNYRSAYLDTLGGTAAVDQFTDANAQLDVHLSYEVMPQATIFFDATNLTNAPWRRYIGVTSQLAEREQYGAQLRGGVQVHF